MRAWEDPVMSGTSGVSLDKDDEWHIEAVSIVQVVQLVSFMVWIALD